MSEGRTIRMCSLDARSEDSLAAPLKAKRGNRKALARANGTSRKSIAKQSEGRAGEKCLPVGGRVKSCVQWDTNQAVPRKRKRASLEDHFVVAVLVLEHRTDSTEDLSPYRFPAEVPESVRRVTTCPPNPAA